MALVGCAEVKREWGKPRYPTSFNRLGPGGPPIWSDKCIEYRCRDGTIELSVHSQSQIGKPRSILKLHPVLYQRVVFHVNRKAWWHVPPVDPDAYKKRGKFLSSSFARAEFWGRPLDEPQRVRVVAPLVGDEATIERKLFGKRVSTEHITIERRFSLDARMRRKALSKGYDSILLMAPMTFARFKSTGEIPRSLELNVLNICS